MVSVFLAFRLDNILAIHCSKSYITAIFIVAILPIPIVDDPDTTCSRQCCSVSVNDFAQIFQCEQDLRCSFHWPALDIFTSRLSGCIGTRGYLSLNTGICKTSARLEQHHLYAS